MEQFAFDGHDRLRASMWTGFGSRGWWLDSSGLDADTTTRRVLDEAHARASC